MNLYRRKNNDVYARQWDGTAEAAKKIVGWVKRAGGSARMFARGGGDGGWAQGLQVLQQAGYRDVRPGWFVAHIGNDFELFTPEAFEREFAAAAPSKYTARRIELALQSAEAYADAHRDEDGVTDEASGMLLLLVSIIADLTGLPEAYQPNSEDHRG